MPSWSFLQSAHCPPSRQRGPSLLSRSNPSQRQADAFSPRGPTASRTESEHSSICTRGPSPAASSTGLASHSLSQPHSAAGMAVLGERGRLLVWIRDAFPAPRTVPVGASRCMCPVKGHLSFLVFAPIFPSAYNTLSSPFIWLIPTHL